MSSRRSAARPGRPSRGAEDEQGPPAPDEIAMPARRSGGQTRRQNQVGRGHASAETCERQTIGKRPAWPLDLALEKAQLVPADQQLEPEAGVRASAIDKGIEEHTEDGIEESEKHTRASREDGSSRSAPPASEFLDRSPGRKPIRTQRGPSQTG